MTDARDLPYYTTHIPEGWSSLLVPLVKTIGIAEDVMRDLDMRCGWIGPKDRGNWRRDASYHDRRHFLACSLVQARSDHGTLEISSNSRRFSIGIYPSRRASKESIVSIRERHRLRDERPIAHAGHVLEILARWRCMLGERTAMPHPAWTDAAAYVGALSMANGAVQDGPEPNVVVLPSAYGPGSLAPTRKTRARLGDRADEGLDLDLSPDGPIGHALSEVCHASRLEARTIDFRGSTRVEYDFSGPVSLSVPRLDAMSAMRALSRVRRPTSAAA